ncbi:MAG: hypothetical protein ACR2L6_01955 [Gemmatimonadaceae bacterium]
MATALGGLVIIGVMIAGVFFTSNQEFRVGTNTFVQERAFRAAEFGLNTTLASWDNFEMALLAPGGSKQFVYDSSAKGWRDSVTVTRLNPTTYIIVSTGSAFGGLQGQSRRKTALLVRLSAPVIDFRGALTVRGVSSIGTKPVISGLDVNPLGWTACPVTVDTIAGLAAINDASLTVCKDQLCLKGTPPLLNTAAAADTTTYFNFADETFTSLTRYATKVYTGGPTLTQIAPVLTATGTCDRNAAENWGAPTRSVPASPCESYFPIIHAVGNTSALKLRGGAGQGILLVDGDLEVQSGFSFQGPVVVRGVIKTIGSGANFSGAVMAANMYSAQNSITAGTVSYSSCAVNKALAGAIPPKRVVERAWMEVF